MSWTPFTFKYWWLRRVPIMHIFFMFIFISNLAECFAAAIWARKWFLTSMRHEMSKKWMDISKKLATRIIIVCANKNLVKLSFLFAILLEMKYLELFWLWDNSCKVVHIEVVTVGYTYQIRWLDIEFVLQLL